MLIVYAQSLALEYGYGGWGWVWFNHSGDFKGRWIQIAEFTAWWIDTEFVNWFKGVRSCYGSWQTIISEVLPKFPPFKSGRWPTMIHLKSVNHQVLVWQMHPILSSHHVVASLSQIFGHRYLLGDFRCRPAFAELAGAEHLTKNPFLNWNHKIGIHRFTLWLDELRRSDRKIIENTLAWESTALQAQHTSSSGEKIDGFSIETANLLRGC